MASLTNVPIRNREYCYSSQNEITMKCFHLYKSEEKNQQFSVLSLQSQYKNS